MEVAGFRRINPNEHINLVYKIAWSLKGRALDWDDLVQEGYLALVYCADTFDPALGYCFSTYAVPMLRWRMLTCIAKEELHRSRETTSKNINETDVGIRFNHPLSSPKEKDSDSPVYDQAEEWIEDIRDPERTILAMWLGIDQPPKTCEEIGRLRGVSKQRAHQILKAGLGMAKSRIERLFLIGSNG